MTAKPNTVTTPPSPADQQAAEIVAAGIVADADAGVDVLESLAKGGTAAFGRLLSMLKGAKAPDAPASKPDAAPDKSPDDEDEGEGEGDEGGDDDSEETERADDGAGYEDMNLAVYQGPNEEVLVDVTEYLERTARRSEAARARVEHLAAGLEQTLSMMKASLKRMEVLEKAVAANGELLAATAGAVVEGQQLLAKGVSAQFDRLLQIPAPSVDFRRPPSRTAGGPPPAEDAALLGGSRDSERQLLAKAMRLSVISHAQAELFRTTRRFSPNVHQSTETRKRVEALAD